MHTGRLVFTPEDPFFIPEDTQAVLQRLQAIEFCEDSPLDAAGRRFPVGERFMQLLTFMGCSPHIQFEPTPDGQPFCHLVLDGPYDKPRFLQGRNTTPPRCSCCKKRIPDWQTKMQAWSEIPHSYLARCPHCGHEENPAGYNWRQSAGSGCLFLCVENIFPNEAIPSPALLQAMQGDAGEPPWIYFYIQDPT